jgi:hypothetical protein
MVMDPVGGDILGEHVRVHFAWVHDCHMACLCTNRASCIMQISYHHTCKRDLRKTE